MNPASIPHGHLPLGARPQLLHASTGAHGRVRRESFHLRTWALHAYPYAAEIELLGQRLPITPGTIGITPPEVIVTYFFPGPVTHRYAHFQLQGARSHRQSAPLLVPDAPEIYGRVWSVLGWLGAAQRQSTLRAEVALWELLWAIVSGGEAAPVAAAQHPALTAALAIIDEELARALTLRDIARRVDVSENHLIRLFRARFGRTVAAYIAQRRAEQARHLLTHTTLPAKNIAASVGLPDLQLFNKTLRRELGLGPRALRAG